MFSKFLHRPALAIVISLLILLMGGMVMLIVLSVMLPILELNQLVR